MRGYSSRLNSRLTLSPSSRNINPTLHISARSSNRPTDTDMQDNEDPVRFKGHHSSSGSNKSPNHRRRAHGNITHTDPRAHLGIRLGLFKAQRLICSRSGGGGGGLTCAVLSFAFALAALRIRPPSLQQQRQQAGGHQAPDDPAGTPAMPRRA